MNPQYQDLYRQDKERLAAWPPKFRGEGPFLPTGRRKPPRRLYTAIAVGSALLMSLAGAQWKWAMLEEAGSGHGTKGAGTKGTGASLGPAVPGRVGK